MNDHTPLTLHGLALYRGDVHVAQGLEQHSAEIVSAVIDSNQRTFEEAEADMREIVRAANCHDDLLAALKEARDEIYNPSQAFHREFDVLGAIEAAIAAATEGQ